VICDVSKIAKASLHAHYVLGLLSSSKSVTDMAERGLLRTFSLGELGEAHRHLESGKVHGKVAVQVR